MKKYPFLAPLAVAVGVLVQGIPSAIPAPRASVPAAIAAPQQVKDKTASEPFVLTPPAGTRLVAQQDHWSHSSHVSHASHSSHYSGS